MSNIDFVKICKGIISARSMLNSTSSPINTLHAKGMLDSHFTDMDAAVSKHYINHVNVGVMISKCKVWYEDFVDEDTGDVVCIQRHSSISDHITNIDVPRTHRTKQEREEWIIKYLDLYYPTYKLIDILTTKKWLAIEAGTIKKYKNVKVMLNI